MAVTILLTEQELDNMLGKEVKPKGDPERGKVREGKP